MRIDRSADLDADIDTRIRTGGTNAGVNGDAAVSNQSKVRIDGN